MPETTVRRITADFDEIREWAEERGGKPAFIADNAGAQSPGEPRIKFSPTEKTLTVTAWEQWKKEFDRRKLALLYIQNPTGEDEDTFFRFVDRDEDFDDSIRPVEDDAPLPITSGR